MNKEEIREALDRIDVSTARGRRSLNGRAIYLGPSEETVTDNAIARSQGYISIAESIRRTIEINGAGITADELEAVEFVIEQIEELSRKAHETAIKSY